MSTPATAAARVYEQLLALAVEPAAELSVAQLQHLRELLDRHLAAARQREHRAKTALARVQRVAAQAGYTLHDLVAVADGTAVPAERLVSPQLAQYRDFVGGPVGHKWTRKPYLNPFDPRSSAYAITRTGTPAWATELMAQGWKKEELHYKNHAGALAKRGLPVLYDAAARHSELTRGTPGYTLPPDAHPD